MRRDQKELALVVVVLDPPFDLLTKNLGERKEVIARSFSFLSSARLVGYVRRTGGKV